MPTTVVQRIDRFNAAHPWSHNDFYHRWILRHLPVRFATSLDVGCGTGNLVRALAGRAGVAGGIDVEPGVIDLARALSATFPTAAFRVLDLLEVPEGDEYDVVTAIAVVHHLPLDAALRRLRLLLAPNGTLVIVGCYRAATRTDRWVDAVAIPANMIVGWLTSVRRSDARVALTAPTVPPQTTLAEIRAAATRALPGARVRRRLFWRYSLIYTAPT
ncbi:class I SAM-dependent methyltransferase [Pengzhenrongella frigida]|uniref:class I SAM-dependent methyltransferase n=1 Tax=Pengzhenrongella frigida TaxID=1259133 RepID=UPI001A9234D4|nr:class I SAM-dependent methyltransferase [Cellulomonas sp. HLT2-17]